ncbi:MAG: transglycosylase domain-containing protein [Pseudomonadota bacterium]|nr:transglycosylase domain-containing protein [Pseudomonadota bacterium]
MLAAPRAHLLDPPPTLLLRDRHGAFLGEVGDPAAEGYGYWPVAQREGAAGREHVAQREGAAQRDSPPADPLPARVVAATLALEDHRFRRHPGVDPLAIARAVRQNLTAGSTLSGASTLAMQVARMQDPGPRTLPKKAVEAVTAVLLTARYGRDAVLAQYLRLAPYGNNIHGIGYAARRYLDKPVSDLSWAETAFLCALPQAPSRTNPFDREGRARAVRRAGRILVHLRAEGLLSDAELSLATEELAALRIPEKGRRPPEVLHVVLRLAGTLDRRAPLVDTTLDLPLQKRVTTVARDALAGWPGAPNAAVMVVDRATGEVHASVGSADYDDAARAGAIDYTRTPRSPGSTLKPFLYALALDRGIITPATVLDDIGRGPDAIENADAASLGPLLPRQALANSRNVPAVDLLDRIGLEEGYAFLRELGLHADERPARHYGLGLAIGGLPVTLEGLVTAYTGLAGDGHLQPLAWRRAAVLTPGARVLSEPTVRRIALYLSDPMARLPSFPRMGATEYPFPVAVKTGTSADYRDAWTMAWSSRWLVGVWVGDPTSEPMARLGGFSAAAEVAQRVLLHLHHDEGDGLADGSFPPPAGQVTARVCPLTGQRAGEACPRAVNEWLAPSEVPTDPCGAHQRLAVDLRDGRLATASTPARYVRDEIFVNLPARFAAWQSRAGLPRPPVESGAAAPAGSAREAPVVRLLAPANGQHVVRDPEAPGGRATLALEASVDPPVAQLLWYVDGEPFAVVDAPYTVRWPLTPGEHHFEARIPFTPIGSREAHIIVQ